MVQGKKVIPQSVFERILASAQDSSTVSSLTHDYYRYPARFPPRFVGETLEALTEPGDVVLDPFMGGGTTIVEALQRGRRAIGMDISSLACFIARAKVTPIGTRQRSWLADWYNIAKTSRGLSQTEVDADWIPYTRHVPEKIQERIAGWVKLCDTLSSSKAQRFMRAVLLKTAQDTLDCTATPPSLVTFQQKMGNNLRDMFGGMARLLAEFKEHAKSKERMTAWRRIISRSAKDFANTAALPEEWPSPQLVVTSPPYPGVHILYHRWQIKSRKETPAPFWIAGQRDGHGESHYTFGGRHRTKEVYFDILIDCFKGIGSRLAPGTPVVQLIAFPDPEAHLEKYLNGMKKAGFRQIWPRNPFHSEAWRDIPRRKWYTSERQNTKKELVLVHKKAGK